MLDGWGTWGCEKVNFEFCFLSFCGLVGRIQLPGWEEMTLGKPGRRLSRVARRRRAQCVNAFRHFWRPAPINYY